MYPEPAWVIARPHVRRTAQSICAIVGWDPESPAPPDGHPLREICYRACLHAGEAALVPCVARRPPARDRRLPSRRPRQAVAPHYDMRKLHRSVSRSAGRPMSNGLGVTCPGVLSFNRLLWLQGVPSPQAAGGAQGDVSAALFLSAPSRATPQWVAVVGAPCSSRHGAADKCPSRTLHVDCCRSVGGVGGIGTGTVNRPGDLWRPLQDPGRFTGWTRLSFLRIAVEAAHSQPAGQQHLAGADQPDGCRGCTSD